MKKRILFKLIALFTGILLIPGMTNLNAYACIPDSNIYLNTPKIEYGHNTFTFVCPASRYYTFYTTGTADTYVELMEDSTILESDDNSGKNSNFKIFLFLVEDKTYTLNISLSSGNMYTIIAETGSYNLCYIRNMYNGKYLRFYNIFSCETFEQERVVGQLFETFSYIGSSITKLYASGVGLAISHNQQEFNVIRNDDNTYRIMVSVSGNDLALTGSNSNSVSLASYTGLSWQKWRFEAPDATLASPLTEHSDTSIWINAAKVTAGQLGTNVNIIKNASKSDMLQSIKNSNYFAIVTHGYSNDSGSAFSWLNNQDEEYINLLDIFILPDNYFKNTTCALLSSCELAKGGANNPNNFINYLHTKGGVGSVVGFQNEVASVNDSSTRGIYLFNIIFTRELANGKTVKVAAENARNEVWNCEIKLGYVGRYFGTDSFYIAGNETAIVKR